MYTKVTVLAFFFILLLGSANAQDLTSIEKIELKEAADYQKNENVALGCANYLLSRPVEKANNDIKHLKALQFLIRWMDGSPDYSFSIDASIDKASDSNPAVLAKFLASMVKYVMENISDKDNKPSVKYNSFLIFLDYCANPANQVTL